MKEKHPRLDNSNKVAIGLYKAFWKLKKQYGENICTADILHTLLAFNLTVIGNMAAMFAEDRKDGWDEAQIFDYLAATTGRDLIRHSFMPMVRQTVTNEEISSDNN